MIRPAAFSIAVLFLALASGISLVLVSANAQQGSPMQGNVYQQGMGPYNARQNGPQQGGPAPENVLIILDASYSMIEPMGRESKMAVAKRTILEVLQRVPPNVNVGLRVYGTSTNSFTACQSTKLLAPIGMNNRQMIANAIMKIKPTGATPISYTLSKAVREDFMGLPGKKSIILVSDGVETCASDPCTVAVDMVRKGVDVKINVIGFGVDDYAAIKQLRCIALSTFGKFSTANTSGELVNSLNKSLNAETQVQGRILLPQGNSPSPPPSGPGGLAAPGQKP